ncbi:hypothetical protein J4526_07470 [Desulfurococcaceae archaeon MEX13E-LK6-19]|nr:hypothetical protein J4526_07470 [Desulfurococcaceae archaeon MEX13E-LK6-19]
MNTSFYIKYCDLNNRKVFVSYKYILKELETSYDVIRPLDTPLCIGTYAFIIFVGTKNRRKHAFIVAEDLLHYPRKIPRVYVYPGYIHPCLFSNRSPLQQVYSKLYRNVLEEYLRKNNLPIGYEYYEVHWDTEFLRCLERKTLYIGALKDHLRGLLKTDNPKEHEPIFDLVYPNFRG